MTITVGYISLALTCNNYTCKY